MRKSIILTLVLILLVSISGTTFAADFTDVPAQHWAYDAVRQLSKDGFVSGFGDGTYRGNQALTRYEFAVVTARALEKYAQADDQQKKLLDKLSVEFTTELNTIGVRLTKLEKNQPNLKFTGSSEVRYTSTDYNSTGSKAFGAYRIRVDGLATVDENTALGIRIASGTTKAGTNYRYSSSSFTSFGTADANDDNKNTYNLDRYFITRKIGDVKVTLGGQGLQLGINDFIVDSGYTSYDGIKFEGKAGNVNLVANWGRQQKNAAVAAGWKASTATTNVATAAVPGTTIDIASLEATTTYGKLNYGAGYALLKDHGDNPHTLAKYLYGQAIYTFDPKFSLGGQYVQNKLYSNNQNAWTLIATIGDQVIANKGQNNVVIKYYSVGHNSISRLTAYNLQNAATATDAFADVQNQKGLNITYNYGFSKNLSAYVAYQKLTDNETTTVASTDQGYQFFRVGVIAKF